MAQPNRTKTALLGFLAWGPMSGYDLRQLIDGSIANFWNEGYGRIYPMLAQLADEGLATRAETRSEGGRPRNVYSITEAGRRALDAWLNEPTVPRPLRNERLLKLFFGARAEPEALRASVDTYRAELLGDRERYGEIRERLEAVPSPPRDQRFWLLTLRYGELETDAQLRWCDEVDQELDRMDAPPTKGESS